MGRAFVVAFLLSSLAACAARTSPPVAQPLSAEPARLTPLEQLRVDLQQIFTAPPLDHANWGVKIESLRTGETLYGYNAFKFLLPGSNQKLLSAAVAAERLGWDYRFTTRLVATGPVDANGTLEGDLVVVGNGDPSINPRHPDRSSLFDTWAASLHARGVRAISGRIVGDDNAFVEPGLGRGWTWENLRYGFGTAVGALQFNENQIVITVTPGAVGAAATVVTKPASHGMVIEAHVATATPGSENTVDIERLPGSKVLRVRGDIAADAKPMTIRASVENPTQFYVNALKAALAARGITVGAGAVDVDELPVSVDLTNAIELVVDESPPLSEIIDVCLKWSRNEYAETLLRALAAADAPATPRAALGVMREQLATWGIPSAYAVPADGSGLSREDYLTAHALTALLTYLWMDPKHAETFRSTLPVAAVSGTLAERMKGTPLEGRVWAKTGTLANVRGLSGYLLTPSGDTVVFAMLSNNFQVRAADIDAAMESALLRVLQYGSTAALTRTSRAPAGSP